MNENKIRTPESSVLDQSLINQENQLKYDLNTPSSENVEQSFATRMQSVRKVGKWGLRGTVIVGLVAGGMYLKDIIEDFTPDASHKLEIDINNIKSTVYENQSIKFATVVSEYNYVQTTSLDRFGPINCDTKINASGKNKVRTETDGEILIDKIKILRNNDGAEINIDGDLALSRTSVDWPENFFKDRIQMGDTDVCIGANELSWADSIADTVNQQVGQVSAACALESKVGKQVFEQSLVEFASKTPFLEGVDPKKVKVNLGDYEAESAKLLGLTKDKFNYSTNKMIKKYLNETADHKKPKINTKELMDCAKHSIEIAKGPKKYTRN